ncbi:MAG TPA: hypothetical protein VL200_00420 [Lacunisphaera sp.]|jgi:hypothetical protein|nr:hypothetical protein [Lacunisphaera sp.]
MFSRPDHEPDRARRYSTPRQLARIDEKSDRNVRLYGRQSRDMIDARIAELRAEWSLERVVQLNIAAVGLGTVLLALTRNRRWGLATCGAMAFLFLHATDGFAPPVPVWRELGFRSRAEIDREIYALKAVRGDFDEVEPIQPPAEEAKIDQAGDAVGV